MGDQSAKLSVVDVVLMKGKYVPKYLEGFHRKPGTLVLYYFCRGDFGIRTTLVMVFIITHLESVIDCDRQGQRRNEG